MLCPPDVTVTSWLISRAGRNTCNVDFLLNELDDNTNIDCCCCCCCNIAVTKLGGGLTLRRRLLTGLLDAWALAAVDRRQRAVDRNSIARTAATATSRLPACCIVCQLAVRWSFYKQRTIGMLGLTRRWLLNVHPLPASNSIPYKWRLGQMSVHEFVV